LKRPRNLTYAAQLKRRRRALRILSVIATLVVIATAAALLTRGRQPAAALSPPTQHATSPNIDIVASKFVLDKMTSAGTITLAAYSLQATSAVVRDLEAAADRGAHVSVALSRGFGFYVAENRATANDLSAHGVKVHILESTTESTHMKAVVLDGDLYLSDRNWTTSYSEEIVVHDTVPGDRTLVERAILGETSGNDHLWTRKADALAAEAALLDNRHSNLVRISSESFGSGTPVFDELMTRAKAGDQVELIVANAEYHSSRSEAAELADLAASGVKVRTSNADEKFTVDGDAVWIGSANATRGVPNQIDFGITITDTNIARRLENQFDSEWARATPESASQ
jgi:phosphatidylserine/phosphatidylglycerophosphate/cardiolipin synthase-like enzyme